MVVENKRKLVNLSQVVTNRQTEKIPKPNIWKKRAPSIMENAGTTKEWESGWTATRKQKPSGRREIRQPQKDVASQQSTKFHQGAGNGRGGSEGLPKTINEPGGLLHGTGSGKIPASTPNGTRNPTNEKGRICQSKVEKAEEQGEESPKAPTEQG